jgi:diaminohydroxyphosphoribosylaminopyrimidine deaminase/5-amino-6-(5-phosphoribosylamino)uracil reductase
MADGRRGRAPYDEFDHAEIVALKQAGEQARGADRVCDAGAVQPSWADGALRGCADCGWRAAGGGSDGRSESAGERVRGLRRLRAAGVEVVVGVLEREAREVNEAFAKFIRTGRPLVTLKAALSADGMLAPRAFA